MFCGAVFAGIGGAVAMGVASASGGAVTIGVASGVGVISILGVGVLFATAVASVFGFFADESETLGLQAENENEHIKIIMNVRYLFGVFIMYYHLRMFL